MGNCEPKCIPIEERTNCCVETMFEQCDQKDMDQLFAHGRQDTIEESM